MECGRDIVIDHFAENVPFFLSYFRKFPSYYIRFPTLLLDSENARNSNQTVIIFPLFASGHRTGNVKRKRAKSVFRRIPLAIVYPVRKPFGFHRGEIFDVPLAILSLFYPFSVDHSDYL